MKYIVLLYFLSLNCLAQKGELVIAEYSSDIITLNFLNPQFEVTSKEVIDISKFEGWLGPSKYGSSYSHFPLQFFPKGNRLLISLINEDELQDVSYWTKFLSYDFESKELRELLKIDGTSISFWHLIDDNEIVGISGQALIKVDLSQTNCDTLAVYDYYPHPRELLTSKSIIEFVIEGRNNISMLSYNIISNQVDEVFISSTTSFSSIHNENFLTIEGQGISTLKLRKAGLYSLVSVEKKMDLSNYNSFWDTQDHIYLMTKTGILKVDDSLEKIDKMECSTPHIEEIIDDWIIYSTRMDGASINDAKYFATSTTFDKTYGLPYLNNGKSIVLITKRP